LSFPAAGLSERDEAILRAVIELHILTAEPVSSSQLCLHYTLLFSSATVRNVMLRLEDAGFLSHPYTSSGKVPTVKAYRYFVGQLLRQPAMPGLDLPNLQSEWLQRVQEVEQMIKLTAGVLAAVSQLLAVTWVGSCEEQRLRRVELLPLGSQKILLVAVTDFNPEAHHVLDCGEEVSRSVLAKVAALVNEHGRGLTSAELSELSRAPWPGLDRRIAEMLRQALAVLGASLQAPGRREVVVEGAANLMAQPEFQDVTAIRSFVSMLDHHEALLQYFAAPGLEHGGFRVVIGDENPQRGLPPLAYVTAGIALQGGLSARIGVIGPVRMAYGRVISLLGRTAATMARALDRDEA
jgi:heat-inducible transcriptional repressor